MTLKLVQRTKDGDIIGRFRVYLVTADNPLREGVPTPILAAGAKPLAERSPEDKAALETYVRNIMPEHWRLKKELSDAKVELAPDPALTALKTDLDRANQPVVLDPQLVQLRKDIEASKQQVANKRLTVVQDLTWALINNPAFLFNR